jgi:PhoPQ-activated pathogenicity-related protein
LYCANTDHGLNGSGAEKALLAWYTGVLAGKELPQFSWNVAGEGHMTVTAKTRPTQVMLWTATNPTARDFRLETIGKAWTSSPLTGNDKGIYDATVKAPEKGWTLLCRAAIRLGHCDPVPLQHGSPHRPRYAALRREAQAP